MLIYKNNLSILIMLLLSKQINCMDNLAERSAEQESQLHQLSYARYQPISVRMQTMDKILSGNCEPDSDLILYGAMYATPKIFRDFLERLEPKTRQNCLSQLYLSDGVRSFTKSILSKLIEESPTHPNRPAIIRILLECGADACQNGLNAGVENTRGSPLSTLLREQISSTSDAFHSLSEYLMILDDLVRYGAIFIQDYVDQDLSSFLNLQLKAMRDRIGDLHQGSAQSQDQGAIDYEAIIIPRILQLEQWRQTARARTLEEKCIIESNRLLGTFQDVTCLPAILTQLISGYLTVAPYQLPPYPPDVVKELAARGLQPPEEFGINCVPNTVTNVTISAMGSAMGQYSDSTTAAYSTESISATTASNGSDHHR